MLRAGLSSRLARAALVAGAGFASAAPAIYYLGRVAFAERLRASAGLDPQDLLRADVVSLALMVVIAALVGSLASERYGLAGLGQPARVRPLALALAGGIALGVVSYFAFGRRVHAVVPGYYPGALGWASALVLKGAIFDEVVGRYGMMTIIAGVTRRPGHANLLQAIFFTVVGLKSMAFFGLETRLEPIVAIGLLFSFASHLVAGQLYARHGLYASIAFHLGLGADRLVHVALVG